MTTLVSIDARVLAPEQATVSVFDRGFLYGDSVFETLRTYGGVPFALGEHLARLEKSAERVLITLPASPEVLGREVIELVRAAGNPESYIRLMVTRGQGDSLGLDPELARAPTRVIIVTALEVPPASLYEVGMRVITYRGQRIADSTSATGAKLGNYLVAVLAMREARRAGAQEALFVDAEGSVLEGSTSNVFALCAGRLVTAPEGAGILAGITRAKVIAVAAAAGLAVDVRKLSLEELLQAEEVFITSSIRELVPVVSVDGQPIGAGKPGSVTLELLSVFRQNAAKPNNSKNSLML